VLQLEDILIERTALEATSQLHNHIPKFLLGQVGFHVTEHSFRNNYIPLVTRGPVIKCEIARVAGIILNKTYAAVVATESVAVPRFLQCPEPSFLIGSPTCVNAIEELLAAFAAVCLGMDLFSANPARFRTLHKPYLLVRTL
jgi:hypothetical protein